MKKFIVRGGWVTSRTDLDWHYVGVAKVAKLYHLPPGSWREFNEDIDRHLPPEAVLAPRYDGGYYDAMRSGDEPR